MMESRALGLHRMRGLDLPQLLLVIGPLLLWDRFWIKRFASIQICIDGLLPSLLAHNQTGVTPGEVIEMPEGIQGQVKRKHGNG